MGELPPQEVDWVPLAENPQAEPVRGLDAVLEFVADWIMENYVAGAFRDGKIAELRWFMMNRTRSKPPVCLSSSGYSALS
jgi:hypothetical protein